MVRPSDFYEMDFIGDDHFLAALSIRADIDLKRKIMGALKSHFLSLKSVDYTIKRYGDRWSFPDPTEDELFVASTLRAIDIKVESIVRAIMNGKARPDHVGLMASEVALVRLNRLSDRR